MANTNLVNFMEKEYPANSKTKTLNRFIDEIIELREKGYSIHQIKRYLELNYKYSVSRGILGAFVKQMNI